MSQDWVRSLWLFFPVSDLTLLASLQILWLLFLGPCAGCSLSETPQKEWAQLGASLSSFFPSTPFYLHTRTKSACMEMFVARVFFFNVRSLHFPKMQSVLEQWHNGRKETYLRWRGRRPRCGSASSASPGRGKSGPPRRPPGSPRRRTPAAPGWQSASLQGETHAG